MQLEEALAEFLRHLAVEKNASAHTIKSYREDLTQALTFFRSRPGGATLAAAGVKALAASEGDQNLMLRLAVSE